MEIWGFYFSKRGERLLGKLQKVLPAYRFRIIERRLDREEGVRKAFENKTPLLFVGAVGIAVRVVAPFVRDKMTDSPVLVMDEMGEFCIPILSGHLGGANELALVLAEAVGAVPVITTATDVAGAFSVDLFAKEHGLSVVNRDGIVKVSGKALEGKAITLCVKDYPPREPVDVIVSDDPVDDAWGTCALRYGAESVENAVLETVVEKPSVADSRQFVLGVGCKKNKSPDELFAFASDVISASGLSVENLYAIATIDKKQEEPAVVGLSEKWRVPLITFEAAALNRARGEFSASAFVSEVVGTDNVCERAAVLAAGFGAELVVKKQARDGMTAAVALRREDIK